MEPPWLYKMVVCYHKNINWFLALQKHLSIEIPVVLHLCQRHSSDAIFDSVFEHIHHN